MSATKCGTCGLGRLDCSAGEDGVCEEPEALSALSPDNCSEEVLFVDLSYNAGDSDGSSNKPFSSYEEASNNALETTKLIIVAPGFYEEPLVVKEGVSVTGGYTRNDDGWDVDKTKRPSFEPKLSTSDVFGLRVEDATKNTVVSYVRVLTKDASENSNNYGAYVKSSPGLHMIGVDVVAGKAGSGSNGVDGSDGESGTEGVSIFLSCISVVGVIPLILPSGGGNNQSCPQSNGGKGGWGGSWHRCATGNQPYSSYTEHSAESGHSSASGVSGGRGAISTRKAGEKGRDGQNSASTDMSVLSGAASTTIIDGRWHATEDASGKDGQSGADGEGGGGGGGAWWNNTIDWSFTYQPLLASSTESCEGHWGSSGAGGGAGGCGGTAGEGGQAGGTSFGLFVVDTYDLRLSDSTFVAGAGGAGGSGGLGGDGGLGGQGGSGTELTLQRVPTSVHPLGCDFADQGWSSGNGGDGADGQPGSDGGGGAGGSSYGAYCHNSRIDVQGEGSTFKAADTPAPGGSIPRPQFGQPGEDGVVEDEFRCR